MIWGEIYFWPSTEPQPTPWRDGGMGGRLWELVSQTSETIAMAISLLKHINGDPLITNTTLVDLCVGCGCHYTMEI